MKIFNFIILFIISENLIGQNFSLENNLFNNIEETSIYKFYKKDRVLSIGIYENNSEEIADIDSLNYGFYDNCDLPDISNLKRKGKYYFEVEESDYKDEESSKKTNKLSCGEMSMYLKGKDTMVSFFYSSRQQFAIYKKVNSLPQNVIDYMEKIGIQLMTKREILKKINSTPSGKCYIYTSIKPPVKSNKYLIKGDLVEILEKDKEWSKIRFNGKKVIEGWVKNKEIK